MATLQVGIDARQAQVGAAQFEQATGRMRDQAGRFVRGEGAAVERRIKSIGGAALGVRAVLGSMFGALSAGLAVRSAIRTITSFEETLATVRGVSNATAEQFDALNASARELGATTRFSASEAGEGLLFLSRAGFEVEESIGALPGTLNLAIAGALDLGDAADIASNILSTFNLEAAKTGQVVDILANTANSSNTDVGQLAEAIKLSGSVAATAKIPLETLAAATGVLGDNGIQASLAGTNLRGVILGLAAPTTDALNAIQDLGLTYADVSPATNNFIDILDRLREAFASVGDERTLQAANSIFGRRNIGAAIALSNSADRVRELAQANTDSAGTAQRLADIIDDTLAGSFKSLRSSIEEAVLQLGDSGFGGGLRFVIDTLTDGIRVLIGFEEQLSGSAKTAQIVADALRTLGIFLSALVAIKAVVFFVGLAKAIAGATLGMRAFSAAVAANPIGAVATVITLAVTALIQFKDETISVGDETVRVGALAQAVWEATVNKIGLLFNILVDGFFNGLEVIRLAFDTVWTGLRDFVGGVFDGIALDWDAATSVIFDITKFVVNANIAAWKTVADVLGELLGRIIDVGSAFGSLNTDITSGFGLGEVADAIGDAVDPAEIFSDIGDIAAQNFRRDFIGEIADAGAEAYDAVRDGFEEAARTNPLARDIKDLFSPVDIVGRAAELSQPGQVAADTQAVADAAVKATDGIAGLNDVDLGNACNEIDAVAECLDNATVVGQNFGETLANSLSDALLNAESLEDALARVADALLKQLFTDLAVNPVANASSSFFGSLFGGAAGGGAAAANGALALPGNFQAFQSGGVFSGPTFFGLPGGGTGLAGEAGPEAILPLANVGGQLGVKTEGAGQQQNINVVQNITTPDADSFRRSQRQIAEDARRGIQGGT